MTKMRALKKSDHPIYQALGLPTKRYLEANDSQIIEWLDDSRRLLETYKQPSSPTFEDYTFIATSAFKALERWIFLLAPSIGIKQERIEKIRAGDKSVGTLIGDTSQLDVLFNEVLDTVGATGEIRDDLESEVLGLKSFLRNYRHNLAHCWKTLELPADAEVSYWTIINGIRRVTEKLIEVGILKNA